jgi:hypothetical protein
LAEKSAALGDRAEAWREEVGRTAELGEQLVGRRTTGGLSDDELVSEAKDLASEHQEHVREMQKMQRAAEKLGGSKESKVKATQQAEATAAPSQQLECSRCQNKVEKVWQCSGCGTGSYCSRVCQKADWKNHKSKCKELASQKLVPKGIKLLERGETMTQELSAVLEAEQALDKKKAEIDKLRAEGKKRAADALEKEHSAELQALYVRSVAGLSSIVSLTDKEDRFLQKVETRRSDLAAQAKALHASLKEKE